MASARSVLGSLFYDAIRMTMLSVIVDVTDRAMLWFWARFRHPFAAKATFYQDDPAYEWMSLFLAENKVWQRNSDDVIISARRERRGANLVTSAYPNFSENDIFECFPEARGFHSFVWRGYRAEVEFTKPDILYTVGNEPREQAKLQVILYSWDKSMIFTMIEEAREAYLAHKSGQVMIRMVKTNDRHGVEWSLLKSKKARSFDSVILDHGMMDWLLLDVQSFLDSESWYLAKGIPFHRGYLLHGPPGTGKTSTVFAIASRLGFDIYVLSLSGPRMNDVTLQELVSAIPKYAIVLIEDIDCAFPPNSRDESGVLDPHGNALLDNQTHESKITLSGLLNVLDGVSSEEGRLVFATTNHIESLDPALIRAGRFKQLIEYTLATQKQISGLFRRFYAENSADTPNASAKDRLFRDEKVRDGDDDIISKRAEMFAAAIPDQTFSMADIEGFLVDHRRDPLQAVTSIRGWVQEQHLARRRLQDRRRAKGSMHGPPQFGQFRGHEGASYLHVQVSDVDATSMTAYSSSGSNAESAPRDSQDPERPSPNDSPANLLLGLGADL